MPNAPNPVDNEKGSGASTTGARVDLQLRFDCKTIGQFLDRHAADVSRGGIFVRTREILNVGCAVNLDLRLDSGVTLLAGVGTVLWTRAADPARADGEAGMGIRLGKMTAESQEILSFLLAEKARREQADVAVAEFDDVRTVVANNDAPPPAARPENVAAEFDDVRTVVSVEERKEAIPGVQASAVVTTSPAEVVTTSPAEVVTPSPAEVVTPPPVEAAPSIDQASAAPEAPAAPPRRRAAVSPRRKRGLGIGVAIGGLVMIAAWFALASRPTAKTMPSASMAAAAAAAPSNDQPSVKESQNPAAIAR